LNAELSLERSEPDQTGAHWHPCTSKTKSALAQATPDRRGALQAEGVGVASVRVAPETVPRALAVLDGLIRAVEKLGHSIAMQSSPAAMFAINGAFVPVTIFEKFVNNRAPADAEEMRRRHAYERKFPKFFRMMDLEGGWTHRPSGKLTIILSDGNLHGLPSRWADGVSHPVESRVDEVAAAAVAHAQALKSIRDRIEQRTAESRETEQQRQGREVETDLQSRRIAFFKERADMLEEAERLDLVLEQLRHTADYPSIEMYEFSKWAEAYIASLRERCSSAGFDRDLVECGLWSLATTDTE
jgi:hypothetical protein